MRRNSILLMFLVLFASVLPTGAGEFKSVYTSLKLEDCVELTSGQEDEQSQSQGDGEWVCNGHERIAVWGRERPSAL